MNDQQRIRQMQAIHIEYSRLVEAGGLPVVDSSDMRTSCHLWASDHLGKIVSSLKALTDWELNSLRDRLNGKEDKLLARVKAEFARASIKTPDAWLRTVAHSPSWAWVQGYTVETLPPKSLFRLLKCLERRNAKNGARAVPAAQPEYDHTPRRRSAVCVTNEAREAWGM